MSRLCDRHRSLRRCLPHAFVSRRVDQARLFIWLEWAGGRFGAAGRSCLVDSCWSGSDDAMR